MDVNIKHPEGQPTGCWMNCHPLSMAGYERLKSFSSPALLLSLPLCTHVEKAQRSPLTSNMKAACSQRGLCCAACSQAASRCSFVSVCELLEQRRLRGASPDLLIPGSWEQNQSGHVSPSRGTCSPTLTGAVCVCVTQCLSESTVSCEPAGSDVCHATIRPPHTCPSLSLSLHLHSCTYWQWCIVKRH